jgi:predicted nucleotidyltransferase
MISIENQGVHIMDERNDHPLIIHKIQEYIDVLKANGIMIWRIYLHGSYAKGA